MYPLLLSKKERKVILKETIVADKPSLKNDAVTILSPIVDGSDLETEVIREVLAKEIWDRKRIRISVKELERQNPNIIRDLL
jgi:hypothetical protein